MVIVLVLSYQPEGLGTWRWDRKSPGSMAMSFTAGLVEPPMTQIRGLTPLCTEIWDSSGPCVVHIRFGRCSSECTPWPFDNRMLISFEGMTPTALDTVGWVGTQVPPPSMA